MSTKPYQELVCALLNFVIFTLCMRKEVDCKEMKYGRMSRNGLGKLYQLVILLDLLLASYLLGFCNYGKYDCCFSLLFGKILVVHVYLLL